MAVQLPHTVEQPAGWQGEARLWQRTAALAGRLGYGREELRAELLRRRDLDQAARSAFAGAPEDKAGIIAMDDANTAWLRKVVDRVGWPGPHACRRRRRPCGLAYRTACRPASGIPTTLSQAARARGRVR